MHRLHHFLNTIWFSCTSVATYRTQFSKEGWRETLRYLYFLFVLLFFLRSVPLALSLVRALPDVRAGIAEFQEVAPTLFPKNLRITVKDGEAKTNVREPYAITPPPSWLTALNAGRTEQPPFRTLLLFHTRGKVDDFPSQRTVILLTKKSLVVSTMNGGFRTLSLKDFPDNVTIDHTAYTQFLRRLSAFLATVPTLLSVGAVLLVLLFPFVTALAAWLWHLAYVFLLSLPPYALAVHCGRRFTFAHFYRLSLHGLTLPILYTWLEQPVLGTHIPYAKHVLFLLFMSILVLHFPRWKPVPRPVKTPRHPLRQRIKGSPSEPLPPPPPEM